MNLILNVFISDVHVLSAYHVVHYNTYIVVLNNRFREKNDCWKVQKDRNRFTESKQKLPYQVLYAYTEITNI